MLLIHLGLIMLQLASPAALRFLPKGKSLVELDDSLDFPLREFRNGHPIACRR